MMDDFKAVLVEGVFTRNGDAIHGERDTSLRAELTPFIGKRIRLAMHHLPPNLHNPDPSKWGYGSCLWQPHPCPALHHQRPNTLLNIQAEGVLWDKEDTSTGEWAVEKLDGSIFTLPTYAMRGHHGRLAVATLFDVEKMRDALTPEALASVEGLGLRAEELIKMLEQMRKGR